MAVIAVGILLLPSVFPHAQLYLLFFIHLRKQKPNQPGNCSLPLCFSEALFYGGTISLLEAANVIVKMSLLEAANWSEEKRLKKQQLACALLSVLVASCSSCSSSGIGLLWAFNILPSEGDPWCIEGGIKVSRCRAAFPERSCPGSTEVWWEFPPLRKGQPSAGRLA